MSADIAALEAAVNETYARYEAFSLASVANCTKAERVRGSLASDAAFEAYCEARCALVNAIKAKAKKAK